MEFSRELSGGTAVTVPGLGGRQGAWALVLPESGHDCVVAHPPVLMGKESPC